MGKVGTSSPPAPARLCKPPLPAGDRGLLPRREAKAWLTCPQRPVCSGDETSRGSAVPDRYRLVLPLGKGMPLSEV